MKLTPRAKQAIEAACQLARTLGHARVGSQHLVFGLYQLGCGVHFHVLHNLGFSADSLKTAIAAEPPVGSAAANGPTFDTSATTALERGEVEAAAMEHTYLGTEHILLALLAEEAGGANHLFVSQGVDLIETRDMVLTELSSAMFQPPNAP